MTPDAINHVVENEIQTQLTNVQHITGNKENAFIDQIDGFMKRLQQDEHCFDFKIIYTPPNISLIVCHHSEKQQVYKFDIEITPKESFMSGWQSRSSELDCM